jgi:glycosyltransferase involved in cell wall biosynthesis
MSISQPWLTVLVPAFNEEAGLEHTVRLVLAQLGSMDVAAELLIVDDCSTDRTGAIAERLADELAQVRVCHHATNLGIGGGMLTGIAEAQGEWLILIPADLALDLAELPKYFTASRDADIVVGVRSDRRDYSAFRLLVSWVNITVIRLFFGMKQRQYNYISLYRVSVLRAVDVKYWQSAFFFAEILIKAKGLGARLVEVEIGYVPRASGRATGARLNLIARTAHDMLKFKLSTL